MEWALDNIICKDNFGLGNAYARGGKCIWNLCTSSSSLWALGWSLVISTVAKAIFASVYTSTGVSVSSSSPFLCNIPASLALAYVHDSTAPCIQEQISHLTSHMYTA